jgi:hypothetical protein
MIRKIGRVLSQASICQPTMGATTIVVTNSTSARNPRFAASSDCRGDWSVSRGSDDGCVLSSASESLASRAFRRASSESCPKSRSAALRSCVFLPFAIAVSRPQQTKQRSIMWSVTKSEYGRLQYRGAHNGQACNWARTLKTPSNPVKLSPHCVACRKFLKMRAFHPHPRHAKAARARQMAAHSTERSFALWKAKPRLSRPRLM